MLNSRQHAYLDAMGIGVWSLRDAPLVGAPVATSPVQPIPVKNPGLKLGPGGGGVLLICAVDTDSASPLAEDISRTLGSVPVWAWPQDDSSTPKLADAIEENLFTTVAIFGTDLAMQFFDGDLPASLNSAKLVLLPAMQDLQERAEPRQMLWTALCRSGMVSAI